MTTILITGGAGSLGKALIDEITTRDPFTTIRVLDINEYALSQIKNVNVRKLYGDVSNLERVRKAVRGADYVIHAAAMKNLDITEYNVPEMVRINVTGTDNVLSASVDEGIKKVLFISSDKAVEPNNSYGASKQISENMALYYGHTQKKTLISTYRSCNFYKSNGNVIEVWDKQISENKPITITDFDCIRYYVDIEKVASSILNALHLMIGNEVFIPHKIAERKSVRRLFNELNIKDIEYNIMGLRKGEKLSEKLFTEEEKGLMLNSPITDYYIIDKQGWM